MSDSINQLMIMIPLCKIWVIFKESKQIAFTDITSYNIISNSSPSKLSELWKISENQKKHKFSAIWYWFAFNESILWCYFQRWLRTILILPIMLSFIAKWFFPNEFKRREKKVYVRRRRKKISEKTTSIDSDIPSALFNILLYWLLNCYFGLQYRANKAMKCQWVRFQVAIYRCL